MKSRSLIQSAAVLALVLMPSAAQAQTAVETTIPAAGAVESGDDGLAAPTHAHTRDRPGTVLARLAPTPAAAGLLDVLEPVPVPSTTPERLLLEEDDRRLGLTFLAVGAAVFIAGSLADGKAATVLLLGGAGLGAYGVYLIVRE